MYSAPKFIARCVLACGLAALPAHMAAAAIEPNTAGEVKALPVADVKRATVPDDGILRLMEHGFRDWGPALVHYRLDARKWDPKKLELLDSAGQPVPFQISAPGKGEQVSELEFVAALPKGASVVYSLKRVAGQPRRAATTLVSKAGAERVEAGNEYFTLALPLPASKQFAAPVSVEQAPPPILGWKQVGSIWAGGMHFVTPRRLSGYTISRIENGPASIVSEARYRFAAGATGEAAGEYVCRVQVSPGVPVALVTEEFDLGTANGGSDFLMLGLGEKWQQQQIGFTSPRTEDVMEEKAEPLQPYLATKAAEAAKAEAVAGQQFETPLPAKPEANLTLLEKISLVSWGMKGAAVLRGAPGANGTAGGLVNSAPSAAFIPFFGGSWRRAMGINVWNDPNRGVQLALPLSVRPMRWYLDLTDDQSPVSSQEHDPDLPASYGRRVWGLGFGLADVVAVGSRLGVVGLDRYKDWVVDWPEDRARAVYPRAYATPAIVARVKATLDQHPERELLQQLYLINGDPKAAQASAERAISDLRHNHSNNFNVFGLSHYRQAENYGLTIYAEDALSCPTLPPATRAELRRLLALHANLLSEPDFNPRGAGVHLGNPNMPVNRTEALALTASLLPDHPRYGYWMDQIKRFTQFKLASMTEPGGAWEEPPVYQMYGPTRFLSLAQMILRNGGFGDLAKLGYHTRTLEYDANLTMPDPRYKGFRILPGMGNSGNTLESLWGIGVGVTEQADRQAAGFFKWLHHAVSGNDRVSLGDAPVFSFSYLPDVPDAPRPLETTFITGYGVAFRSRFGTPDETAMLLRAGFNKSHWAPTDDLNVILYGQGAPLSPGTGYQYYSGPPLAETGGIADNRVQVGKINARQIYGRSDNTVQDYGFGPHADYAMARVYHPAEYFDDGKGAMEWRRHILFLKSERVGGPNYFVMRDSFPGGADRPTWWHWLNLDGPQMISQQNRVLEMKTKYGASTYFWFGGAEAPAGKVVKTFEAQDSPSAFHRNFSKALGVTDQETKEVKTIYQISGKPGQDYFYLVYPRKDGTAAPQASQPAPGCLKIKTPESTDYNFISDAPQQFDAEGVTFSGKAGSVRVYGDRVTLCLNSGTGRVGYTGYVLEGSGPFERTVTLAALKPGVTKIEGTMEKTMVSRVVAQDGAKQDITVTGEAPFEASIAATPQGKVIRLHTQGRRRVLHMSRPSFIRSPQMFIDGQEWMLGWTDYPSSDWGRFSNSNDMAVPVPDGTHDIVIRQRVFPRVWQRQFTPLLSTASAAAKDDKDAQKP